MSLRERLKTPATVAAYRAARVRRPGRFVAAELLRPPGAALAHRLRGGGAQVVLRHRTRDLEIFHELLVSRAYDPPPDVARHLAGLRDLHVLDLGANIGLFAVRVGELWPSARVTAYEPDPHNAALLERCRALNGADWRIVRAFAGPADGAVRFRAGLEAESRRAWDFETGEDVVEVPAVDVFGDLATAQVLKMDIEGAEWEILRDPRWPEQRQLLAVGLEYHGEPASRPEAAAEAALKALGLAVTRIHHDPALGVGVLWGYRLDRNPGRDGDGGP